MPEIPQPSNTPDAPEKPKSHPLEFKEFDPWSVIPGLPPHIESLAGERDYINSLQDKQTHSIKKARESSGASTFFSVTGPVFKRFEELNKFRTSREKRDIALWKKIIDINTNALLKDKEKVARRFLINRLDDGRIPWQSWVPKNKSLYGGEEYFRYDIPNLSDTDDPIWGVPIDFKNFPGAGKNGEDGKLDFRKHQFFSTPRELNSAFSVWHDTYGSVYKEGDLNKLISQWNTLAPDLGLVRIEGDAIPEREDYPDVLVQIRDESDGKLYWKNLDSLENYLYMPKDSEVYGSLKLARNLAAFPEDKKELSRRTARRASFQEAWAKILESGDKELRSPVTLEEFSRGMNYWTFRYTLQRKLANEKLMALPPETREEFNKFGRFIWEMAEEDKKPFQISDSSGFAEEGWAASSASMKLAADVLKTQKAKIDDRDPTVLTGREERTRNAYYAENLARVVRAVADNLQDATFNNRVPPTDETGRRLSTLEGVSNILTGETNQPFGNHLRLEHAQLVIDLYNKTANEAHLYPHTEKSSVVAARKLDDEFIDKATQYIKMIVLLENKGIQTAAFSEDASPYYTLKDRKTGEETKFSYTYPLVHGEAVKELDRLHDWAVDLSEKGEGGMFLMKLGDASHEIIVEAADETLALHEKKTTPEDKKVFKQNPTPRHTEERKQYRSGRTPQK